MSESFNTGPGPPLPPEDEQFFENFEQTLSVQQKQMSELKEKLLQFEADKKEKAASVKLKADECYQKLMNLKTGANKTKPKIFEDNEVVKNMGEISSTKVVEASKEHHKTKPEIKINEPLSLSTALPPSQKMLLLKQQTEENKRKMAERINNQKGIALKVNKLLEQFDNMQPVFNPVVGMSSDIADCTDIDLLKTKIQSLERTVSQLNSQLQESRQNESITDLLKSNMSYTELQNELNLDDKCMLQHMQNLLFEKDNEKQQLSNQVFDLQENLKEKDAVIDSKTKAITLMSEDLSRKGKNTVDLLEETKLEMVRMQHNFVQIEANLQEELNELKKDVEIKDKKIEELTNLNKIIEEECAMLQEKSNGDISDGNKIEINKLMIDIEEKNKINEELSNHNKELQDNYNTLQEKILDYENNLPYEGQKSIIEELEKEIEVKNKEVLELSAQKNILEEKLENYARSPDEYQNNEIIQLRNDNRKLTEINKEQEKKINELNADIQLMIIQGPQQSSKSPKKGNKKHKKGQINTDPDQMSELQNHIKQLENEISEHQSYITVKDDENNKLRDEIQETKDQLESKCKEILLLQEDITKLEREVSDPNNKGQDVLKLQQLLDDTTVNSKKQIKYLQKQVDSFGKISDAHQAVVNLNQKVFELNNRVAELEEEKGNLQLHLVDYDTNQVPDTEMNNKLTELKTLCQSQMHSIALLESQKFDLVQDLHIARQQISSLEDELADLTQTEENVVSSEIKNIQLEEKLDSLTKLNEELSQHCDELKKDKSVLETSVTELSKIREDLTEKLNACICENEDLVKKIDRIERLNAEKVSSAESIEIVDNLTHKEKLEIENYEKGLSISEDEPQVIDCTKDVVDTKEVVSEMSEDETDLNISVAKLTEESSDLMEKIALFTQERKEVMGRLEILTFENQNLLERISQLEDTSNSKIEEYDKLCKENESLKALNIEIQTEKENLSEKITQLTSDRNILQDDINKLLNEIKYLKLSNQNEEQSNIKELYDSLFEENKNSKEVNELLNKKIADLDKRNIEAVQNLQTIQEEYELYKQTTFKRDCEIKDIMYKLEKEQEHNKKTIEDLNKSNAELLEKINNLRNQANEDLTNNTEMYKSQVNNLNQEIQRLSNLVKSTEETDKLYAELNDLKLKLENVEQECLNYNQELIAKNETVDALNQQIMELYSQIERLTNENKDMENEINGLMDEASRNNAKINQLLSETKQKDAKIEKLCADLQTKQNELQSVQNNLIQMQNLSSLDDNKYADLQEVNKKLEARNKENIEKMKKLAANLKKKSALCVEYEAKLNETEIKYSKIEEDLKQQQSDNKSSEYASDLQEKGKEITELNNKIQELLKANKLLTEKESDRIEISNRISRLEHAIQEKDIKNNELLERVNEHKFNYETSLEAIKAKLNEKEVYIESLEIENNSNKEKVSKLIDGLASIEERRRLLEERAEVLGAKLNEKSAVCSEFANNEDLLIKRMKALVDEDAVLEKRLHELSDQNDQMNIHIQTLTKQNYDLISEIKEKENRIQEYQNVEKSLRETENDNVSLISQNNQLQSDLRRTNDDMKNKDILHQTQLDEMENDFSAQLKILENERKGLVEKVEKLSDVNDNLQDEIIKLKDSLHQLEQNKADLERDNTWIKLQNDSMLSAAEEAEGLSKNIDEKQYEIQELREKLYKAELMLSTNADVDNSILNPLHDEIDQLKNKLHEKDKQIESYQRQNMQLQMAASFGVANEVPFFQSTYNQDEAKIALAEKENIIQNLQETIKTLQSDVTRKTFDNARQEITNEVPFFQSFNQNLSNNENESKDLRNKVKNLEDLVSEQSNKITELNNLISKKESELQRLQPSAQETTPLLHSYFNDQVQIIPTLGLEEDTRKSLEEKVKNLEIILTVKTEHIDELQRLIIEKDNEVTALQNGASSLASKMEEIIGAYQYLQNEFEKKQKEVNELIQPKNISAIFSEPVESAQNVDLKARINELEEMLWRARSEKEEALYKLQQLVYDMDNLKKQNVQLDLEYQINIPEPKSTFKDVVNVDLPPYNEQGNLEVVNDVMVAKKTYLCQEDEQEESGWGLDVEDTFLEEQYQATNVMQSASLELNRKVELLQLQVNNLETEKSQLSEDVKQQQAKLTKLMIKLKEYKNKNIDLQEQLKTLKKSSDGLDSAIEEVLTLRIEELENELKNNKAEAEKTLVEKNNLNKRIDVLVVANERLIESKEHQDLELERLNILVRQLQMQPMQQKSEISKRSENVQEIQNDQPDKENLQKVIQELSIDNEELQALLDDQKKSYEEREKKLSYANLGLSTQVEELTKKIQEVRQFSQSGNSEQLDQFQKNIKAYQNIILTIMKDNELCTDEADRLNINDSVNTFIKYLGMIEKYIKALKEKNINSEKAITENKQVIDNLNQQIVDKCQLIDKMQIEISELNNSLSIMQEYKNKVENLEKQISEFEKLRNEHNNENNQTQINELQSMIAMSQSTIAELNRQVFEKSEYINSIQSQYESMQNANAEMQKYINELQYIIDCDKNSIGGLNAELFEKTKQIESLQNIDKELVTYKNLNNELQQEIQGHLKIINDLRQTLLATGPDHEPVAMSSNEIMNLQQENLNLKHIIEQNKNVIDDLNTRLFDAISQIERLMHTSTTDNNSEYSDDRLEKYEKKIAILQTEIRDKNDQIAQMQLQLTSSKNEEFTELKKHYDEMNAQLMEKCEVLNNLQQQESNNQTTIANLQASLSEKSIILQQLQNENSISAKECGSLQESVDELNTALDQSRIQIESLKTQLAEKSQQLEITENEKREEDGQLISQKIELENQLQACNDKWSQVVEQKCREIADSWKVHLVEVESQFSEKELVLSSQIVELQQQIKEANEVIEKLKSLPRLDDEVALLRVAIEDKQNHLEALSKEAEDLRLKLGEFEEDNKNKENKISLLEQELADNQKNFFDNSQIEIGKLTALVNKQQEEYAILENKFDELTRIHNELQLQSNSHISLKSTDVENLSKVLSEKCDELELVSKKVQDLAMTLEEERKQMNSMRSALESQELELVTLKEQLGVEGDKVDATKESFVDKQNYKLQNQPSTSGTSNLSTTNQSSELDLAMYMLHQRDMRCEELTMEVLSLLQERDTLQLRLSNALRMNENIRDENISMQDSVQQNQNKPISDTSDPAALKEADDTKTGVTVRKNRDFEMLKNKLSELHALDHSRDLRIFDDRKLRQQQQMALVERDFDKLPKEAKQQLIDADYTLSRDYQGPSTSLLNWLWGKGTKKVEHL